MGTRQLEAMREALVAGPVTVEAAQVYADALEEAGHPLAPFARGRREVREQDLPEAVLELLLGSRRGLTEGLVLEHGVLRGVRILAKRSPEAPPRRRIEYLSDESPYEDLEEFDDFELVQPSEEVVELLTEAGRGSVTHVSGLLFDTFKRLCGADLELREASVIEDRPMSWEQEFWSCGTGRESKPVKPVGRLRLRELVMEAGGGSHTLRWLGGSCRRVFERLERVRAPGAEDVCAALLSDEGTGRLRVIEAGEWSATRDERGWHLVVGTPADGQQLYEDESTLEALIRRKGLVAMLSGLVTDVLVRGPQLPLGELPPFVAAARGRPVRFELGHPAEAATRAARGLPERRFDADAPLLVYDPAW